MRNAFADEICKVAAEDNRFVLLSGDIGNRLFDPYKKDFLDRFFNCGVAEANMVTVGAGMALGGMRPFAYTITPFITTKCIEQIRVDVCYHDLPVVIVGVGAGYSYANNGPTHHACEDIAMLRSIPNMTVMCPADAQEVRASIWEALRVDGPVYLRLGKKNEPVIHKTVPEMRAGVSINIKPGDDICILSTGVLLPDAIAAAEMLDRKGYSTRVESFHSVKPLDEKVLSEAFEKYPLVVTLEEHSVLGGLGSAVAEWHSFQAPTTARLFIIGSPDRFFSEAGEQGFVREQLGLKAEQLALRIEQARIAVDRQEAFQRSATH